MFPSRGHTVKLTDASKLPLVEALREALSLGDARVVYYAPDNSIFYIEVERRGRAGCIALLKGVQRLEGPLCLEELRRRLPGNQGTIELIQLDPERVRTDFLTYITALLPQGRRDIERLIAEAGGAAPSQQAPPQPPAAAAPQQPAAQPATPPAATPQQPGTLPAAAPAGPSAAAAAPLPAAGATTATTAAVAGFRATLQGLGLRVGEHFDPLAAAVVVSAGREVEAATPGRSCLEILADIGLLARNVLVDCRGDGARVLAYVDSSKKTMQLLYLDDEGPAAVGEDAIPGASKLTGRIVRVFVY